MYGALRLFYENLITAVSEITLSSQAAGRRSGSSKSGDGSATMEIYGSFAGEFDLSYEIECDSIAGGADVGEATIRWRTSNTTSGSWEQTGITTATTPYIALSSDGLGTGIQISFVGGVGNDFAVGDTWKFECRATYGGDRLIDRNRNTYWKSTGITSESIVIDYGGATEVTGVVLQDHNFTGSAVVKFQANASDSWGSPSYSNTFSAVSGSIPDPLYLYPAQTYRYNRWYFEDTTNTDGYLRVGNIMHADYLELENINADWGSTDSPGLKLQDNESMSGVLRRYLYAQQRMLTLQFGEVFSNDDVDSLITMQEALLNVTTHQIDPLWVHLFSDSGDYLWLMHWLNVDDWTRAFRSYLLNSGVSLLMAEAVKFDA